MNTHFLLKLCAVTFALVGQNSVVQAQEETSSSQVELSSEIQTVSYPRLAAQAELGTLAVLSHSIQFSQNNTYFDYRKSGGQDTTFAVGKYLLDFEFNPQHSLSFLYQPLNLTSQVTLDQDIKQDNVTFAQGTPMRLQYDFPFFRASYLYDFNPDPFETLSAGISLQVRDAVIEFESLDGKQLVSQRNIGPVPILKFRSRNRFGGNWWWGTDIDGFYAPIRYLNGGNTDVVGAILDANLQVGYNYQDRYMPYLSLRYIAGGGEGTSSDREFLGDGYTRNWLHFLSLSAGIRAQVF